MAKTSVPFTFNPNSETPSEQINADFAAVNKSVALVGGGEFSPDQITGDQNNFSTVDASSNLVGVLRLTSDASRTITGLANGEEGRFLLIINVGSFGIVFANQSGSSTATNRIITGTGVNLTTAADDVVFLYYDSTTTRWRVFSFSDALWG